MSFTVYTVTVPVLTRMLTNLAAMLKKAEDWAEGRKIDPAVLPGSRLAPDMRPLTFQVQSATDHSKFILARLAGRTPPSWPDTEATLGELIARVETAIDYVSTFSEADLAGTEGRDVVLRIAGKEQTVAGGAYLLNRGLPNFFFHVTTAYDILRHNGVPLGKSDYLG